MNNEEYKKLLLKSQRDTNLLLSSILTIQAIKSGLNDVLEGSNSLTKASLENVREINEFLDLK